MRYLKVLGLAAAFSAALMGLTGSASATSITTTTGGAAATPTVHIVNKSSHITFANPIATIACNVTFEGNVAGHGAGLTAEVTLARFSLSSCTNNWHATTVTPGILLIHWTSGHDGTVTWTGAKFDLTRLGVTCVYETNNTQIGTITGGNPASLLIDPGASIPINTAESSGLCGTGNAKWEGPLVTTSALFVAP